jgi:hypothetical protein
LALQYRSYVGWMGGADYKILACLTALWSLGGLVALLAASIWGGIAVLFTRNRFSTFPGVTAMACGVALPFCRGGCLSSWGWQLGQNNSLTAIKQLLRFVDFVAVGFPNIYLNVYRIDVHVEVPEVDYEKLSSDRVGESSASIRERDQAARERQRVRFGRSDIVCNSDMRVAEVRKCVNSVNWMKREIALCGRR